MSTYAYNPFTDNLDRITPSGYVPPGVPNTFPTDINGPALANGNSLSILGSFTGENFVNGIVTDGDSGSGNLYISLTNRFLGEAETDGLDTVELIQFDLGNVAGVFIFTVNVCAFESTGPAGAAYQIVGACRTTGAAATLLGIPNIIANEEASLSTTDIDMTVSGNTMNIEVTGVVGLNINWTGTGYYVFGS